MVYVGFAVLPIAWGRTGLTCPKYGLGSHVGATRPGGPGDAIGDSVLAVVRMVNKSLSNNAARQTATVLGIYCLMTAMAFGC